MARIRPIRPIDIPRIADVSTYQCTLYVIQEGDDGPFKIGVAEHPARRLCILQTGNPRQLYFRAIYEGSRASCLDIESLVLRYFKAQPKTSWVYSDLDVIKRFIGAFVEQNE